MMLLHGDCLDELKNLADRSVDAIITDPPYGIDYQSSWKIDKTTRHAKIANDLEPFTPWMPEAYRVLKQGGGLLCFTRFDTEEVFRQAMRDVGFKDKQQIIWDKEIHGMGDLLGDFASRHENIIFATKGEFRFPGTRPQSVFRVQRVTPDKLVHPNEKPIELLQLLASAITPAGGTILDPFMGSGSMAVAAASKGFDFVGVELNDHYYNLVTERVKKIQRPLF